MHLSRRAFLAAAAAAAGTSLSRMSYAAAGPALFKVG